MLLVELTDGGVQNFGFHFVVIGVEDGQAGVFLFHRWGYLNGQGFGIGAARPAARRAGGQRKNTGQRQAKALDIPFFHNISSFI